MRCKSYNKRSFLRIQTGGIYAIVNMLIVFFSIHTATMASCVSPIVTIDSIGPGVYVLKQCETYAPTICVRDTFSRTILMDTLVAKSKNYATIAIARIDTSFKIQYTGGPAGSTMDSVHIVIDSVIKGTLTAGWNLWVTKQSDECERGYTQLKGRKFLVWLNSGDDIKTALPDPQALSASDSVFQKGFFVNTGRISCRTMPGIYINVSDYIAQLNVGIIRKNIMPDVQSSKNPGDILKSNGIVLYTPDGRAISVKAGQTRLRNGVYIMRYNTTEKTAARRFIVLE
jgi:hypothetical protein